MAFIRRTEAPREIASAAPLTNAVLRGNGRRVLFTQAAICSHTDAVPGQRASGRLSRGFFAAVSLATSIFFLSFLPLDSLDYAFSETLSASLKTPPTPSPPHRTSPFFPGAQEHCATPLWAWSAVCRSSLLSDSVAACVATPSALFRRFDLRASRTSQHGVTFSRSQSVVTLFDAPHGFP